MKFLKYTVAALAFALPASASEFEPAMKDFLESEVRAWSTDPVLLDALRARNAMTAAYSQDQIDAMDQAWRAEVGMSSTPTIDPIMVNAAADFLREQVALSGGRMTEVILMDAKGLNAAVSHITSDMWQGDEAKYIDTFLVGPDAAHFSDIEKDESTGRFQGQISFSIVDPATGEVLGAMTVGVDADSLL